MTTTPDTIEQTQTDTKIAVKRPSQYLVIFHNDDYTPFAFVEEVLVKIFNKTRAQAEEIAMKVHQEQKAIVAIYPKEIALTKKHLVDTNAQRLGFPLNCEVQPEE